ncbi:MAG: hypothetical protein DRJ97_04905 [Thermoprotei archaeon]|nr:MAG: hypothetical protein DRJ97_04905 [Thermoprotei archaeon]
MSELVVEDLSVKYPGSEASALSGVNFTLPRGGFMLLLGRSGSGKSTLAKAITGVIPHIEAAHVEGRVEVFGVDPRKLEVFHVPRVAAYVAQSPYDQVISGTVKDEVVFTLENAGFKGDLDAEALKVLEQVGLEDLGEAKVEELSGGQLQKLAIACALAVGSELIVLDEPLAHLDPRSAGELVKLLGRLKREGRTIILVEHRLRDLVEHCHLVDKVVLLDNGRLVDCFPGCLIHEKVPLLVELGIRVPANFKASLHLKVGLKGPSDVEPLAMILKSVAPTSMEGSELGSDVVELSDVWVSYTGENYVLRNVNLAFKEGLVYAVMGPNASGKTTLLLTIMGLLKPRRGVVKVAGRRVRGLKDLVGVVGYVPQNPDLILMFESVEDELAERSKKAGGKVDLVKLARELRIDGLLDRNPHSLSRGQRFRVALAASLASSPRVLLLDEPTTGQDEECIAALGEALRSFVEEGGLAVVTTHDVDFASNYADRCVVLCDGVVRAEGPSLDVLSRDDVVLSCGLTKPLVVKVTSNLKLPPISERLLFSRLEVEVYEAEPRR